MKHRNLSYLRFGYLSVLRLHHTYERPSRPGCFRYFYLCKCDCGNNTVVASECLKNGHVKSCGCYRATSNRIKKTTHGLRHTRIYKTWQSMIQRCDNKRNSGYKDYGGRGICVCDEWKNNFQTFYNWAIQNGYNDSLTIDRIDVDGNYCPENCRWATPREQALNRRNSRNITYNGKTQHVSDWCKQLGLPTRTIIDRIYKKNWSFEKAINTPIKRHKSS